MSNFLSSYLTYAAIDEAPEMWHLWAGYGALSATIGRRIWWLHGDTCIYPNLYMLFVGSAAAGKNSALAPCRKLLQKLEDVPLSYAVETVEGVCRKIGGRPDATPPKPSTCLRQRRDRDGNIVDTHEMCFMANEFIDLIRIAPEAWTVFMNNIYDCQTYDYGTKNVGEDILTNPYITLIAGLTTGQAHKLQKIDIMNTGFARRNLLQYGERMFHAPVPVPVFGPTQARAKEECLSRLHRIREFSGQVRLTPEADALWDTWYRSNNFELKRRATPATEGYYGSKSMQVQKLSMLNSLAVRDDLVIGVDEIEEALKNLADMEASFPYIFGAIGRNQNAQVAAIILEHIKRIDAPITYRRIFSTYFNQFSAQRVRDEILEVMDFLVKSGEVVMQFAGNPPEQCWALPDVMEKFLKPPEIQQ